MELRMFAAIKENTCIKIGEVFFLDCITEEGCYQLKQSKNDILKLTVSEKQLQEDFMELKGHLEVEVHIDREEYTLVTKTCLNGYCIAEERKTYFVQEEKETLYDRESMDEIERRRRRNPHEWSQ